MTDQLIEQIREDDAKGLILDPLEARILADAKIITAADELERVANAVWLKMGQTQLSHELMKAMDAYRAAVSEARKC